MKKIFLITIGFCALIIALGTYFVCNAFPFGGKHLRGSGLMATRTMEAPAFEGIDASRAVRVVIADTDRITIEADDNLIDHVVVEVHDGELKVGIANGLKNFSDYNVKVTVPNNGQIRSLEASSAANITANVALTAPEFSFDASSAASIVASVKAEKCEIDASSASKIKAAIIATTCEIEASSASKVELTGTTQTCRANLSSASKLKAVQFVTATFGIDTSSGSRADINCTEKLQAKASSGSSIAYQGPCTAQISESSGGRIHKN